MKSHIDPQTYGKIRNLAKTGHKGRGFVLTKFTPEEIEAAYAKVSANYNLSMPDWALCN